MDVELILVPYDSGQRGTRMGAGPQELGDGELSAELARAGHPVVATKIIDLPPQWRTEIGGTFTILAEVAAAVRHSRAERRFPLVLAGNCNTAVGTVGGLGGNDTAVVWFDAHGDFNTPETTMTGFLDGMALAMLTGRCWSQLTRRVSAFRPVAECAVCLVGARDLDPLESEALARSSVTLIPPPDVAADLPRTLATLRQKATRVYVHVDLDVLDVSEGCANEFNSPDGLTLDGLTRAIGAVGAALPIESAALTAYDPAFDEGRRMKRAAGNIARAILDATIASGSV